ncbi:hypothetical protein [Dyadobacter psychrotolerans]|jgi:hypothetical protein|uniref:Uncharacterized protein n=1 Tax=Dyadobacter psychrotolerans TaxID=2541721 RepID=A0A4R5D8D7_9BACT|nr:hypothetical protein [Dyadobacter psychrotolerans]TDE09819.1 hypothetical protein E0F88_29965 [Dyadobacter psychrotolerans]
MKAKNILTLDYILETYGPDALEPQFIPSREDDGEDIFIPKIRGDMSFEDWLLLPQEFRLFVTQIFIMKFQ